MSTGTLATGQTTEQGEKAFLAALDLCSGPVETLDSARAVLTKTGWAEFDEGPARIVWSNRIAFSIDETDLLYTVSNASFMTVSLFGNSALGPNQLAFEHTNMRLALIGVEEGTSWCAFVGPEWLLKTALTNGLSGGISAKTGLVTIQLGASQKAMSAIALLDVEAFIEAYAAAEPDETKREEMIEALPDALMPTNILVLPIPQDGSGGEK